MQEKGKKKVIDKCGSIAEKIRMEIRETKKETGSSLFVCKKMWRL